MGKEAPRQVGLFQEWLSQRGIIAVLFDLDDTLIDTHQLFLDQMLFFTLYVHYHTGIEFDSLWQNIKRVNNNAFFEYKVNPKRWNAVVEKLIALYPHFPAIIFKEGGDLFKQIYNLSPEFFEGAEETLGLFRSLGVKIGIITHANKKWTEFKCEKLRLQRFLPWEQVFIVHEDKFKEARDWRRAINKLGAEPHSILAVGDNVPGDMIASYEAGIIHRVYIPSTWSVYSQGELPPGTIVVSDGINKLVETLVGI